MKHRRTSGPVLRHAAFGELLDRGVYIAPYLTRGHEVLIAVTSGHEWLRPEIVLDDGIDPKAAKRKLQDWLEQIDPDPKVLPFPEPLTARSGTF